MVGTLHFGMCRNVPKRCVVSGVLVSSVLFSYKVLDTEAPMLALPLRLPTAPYGGHMGHFLLSVLMLGLSTVRQYRQGGSWQALSFNRDIFNSPA